MTSQLTPERSTALPQKKDETRERVFLQPWFWAALLCIVALAVFAVVG
ncbi:hypothetical protein H7K24_13160 [Mycobacterium fragae]|jgi:hypothetical protein|nr:hypothetical protein [Mycobacterium fragae]MCV7401104.1 hypothetical protein [Mycobacterium fragae]